MTGSPPNPGRFTIAIGGLVGVLLLLLWAGWRLQTRLDDLATPRIALVTSANKGPNGHVIRLKVTNEGRSAFMNATMVQFGDSKADSWPVPWRSSLAKGHIRQGDSNYLYMAIVGTTGIAPLKTQQNASDTYLSHDFRAAFPDDGMSIVVDLFSDAQEGAVDRITIHIAVQAGVPAGEIVKHEHGLVGSALAEVNQEAINS